MSPRIVSITDYDRRCHQVDLNTCRYEGLANPPEYFAQTPRLIENDWLEEKLGAGQSLEIWQRSDRIWLVVDPCTGDGVSISDYQCADIRVVPQTITTPGPPKTRTAHPTEDRGETLHPRRDPDQPSVDRQQDIIAAIKNSDMPLQRDEIVSAMRRKTVGKLGANLSWMVKNGKLIHIQNRGYWLPDIPPPV